jgi:hypothetical protein
MVFRPQPLCPQQRHPTHVSIRTVFLEDFYRGRTPLVLNSTVVYVLDSDASDRSKDGCEDNILLGHIPSPNQNIK